MSRRGFLCSIFVLLLLSLSLTSVQWAKSAELEPFKALFAENLSGSFALTGNTNQTCSTVLGPNSAECVAARNFHGDLRNINNDSHVMRNIEQSVGGIDRAQIFNSSANEIVIPRNSKVVKAFLFWFGTLEVPAKDDFGVAPVSPEDSNQVIFAGPKDNCQPISKCLVSGTQYTESLGSGIAGFYAAHADVTDSVTADLASGWTPIGASDQAKYTVANVQSAQGIGTSAGWSLVVVYANNQSALQHIEVKSGFALVAPRSVQNFTFSGFDTPLTGDFQSEIGLVGIDGDAGTVGDSLTIHSQAATLVSDFSNDANNIMNSSISTDGLRSPYLSGQSVGQSKNTFGIEADRFSVTNAIEKGTNSVRLNLSSTADSFYLPAVVLATQLSKSKLHLTKYISNVIQGGVGSAATVTQGDTLEYAIAIQSIGTGVAKDIHLTDIFPTKYLTNLQTTSAGCAVVGVTLTCPNLGNLAPSDPPITVKATAEVKPGTGYFENFATSKFTGNQGDSTTISNSVTAEYLKVALDLALEMKFIEPFIQAGQSPELELTVTNYGPFADDNPSLRLAIPTGLSPTAPLPAGCEFKRSKISCNAIGLGLAPGAELKPGASLKVVIGFTANPQHSNYRVSGLVTTSAPDGDTELANNFAQSVIEINHPPVARPIKFLLNQNAAVVSKVVTDFVSDPDFDPLSFKVNHLSAQIGRLVIVGAQIKFKVAANWHGVATTTYQVTDGRGGSTESQIYIVVKPKEPPNKHNCRGFVRTGC